jgi:hypothetical protein
MHTNHFEVFRSIGPWVPHSRHANRCVDCLASYLKRNHPCCEMVSRGYNFNDSVLGIFSLKVSIKST